MRVGARYDIKSKPRADFAFSDPGPEIFVSTDTQAEDYDSRSSLLQFGHNNILSSTIAKEGPSEVVDSPLPGNTWIEKARDSTKDSTEASPHQLLFSGLGPAPLLVLATSSSSL